MGINSEAHAFLDDKRLLSRAEVLARPSPVPQQPGVYGWWFDELPSHAIDIGACQQHGEWVLLYTGISPTRPPMNGRQASRSHLRQRIETHYKGNAAGSTLRKTLGALLADALVIQLRRVGSGNRMTFLEGERALSQWMDQHARVSFVLRGQPWELEDELIREVDLPLNLAGNARNGFHPTLTAARRRAVERADELPVLPNPGVGGRYERR